TAAVSDPVNCNVSRFLKTSRFIVGLPALRSESSMAFEAQKQQREKSKKTLIDTNLVIFGGGTRVSLVGQAHADAGVRTTAAPARLHPSPTQEASGASN